MVHLNIHIKNGWFHFDHFIKYFVIGAIKVYLQKAAKTIPDLKLISKLGNESTEFFCK